MVDSAPPRTRERTRPAAAPEPVPRDRVRSEAVATTRVDRIRPDASGIGTARETVKDTERRRPVEQPARTQAIGIISVNGGTTIKTAPFEGIRVDVRIDWPVGVDLSSSQEAQGQLIDSTYGWISQKVEELVQHEIDIALAGLAPAVAPQEDDPV